MAMDKTFLFRKEAAKRAFLKIRMNSPRLRAAVLGEFAGMDWSFREAEGCGTVVASVGLSLSGLVLMSWQSDEKANVLLIETEKKRAIAFHRNTGV